MARGRTGIPRRTADELRHMRAAGRVVAEMHVALRAAARPGVTTAHLDRVARDVIERRGAESNFFGYHGFPGVICASVNDEVIHGIPGSRVLQEGDLLSVDCGAIVAGWHGDAAFSIGIGTISPVAQRLIDTAEAALAGGIKQMRAGRHLGDVGAAIEAVVAAGGYGNPLHYCGHGIGRSMHEEPDVENRGRSGRGVELLPGMVLAIEPMLLGGGDDRVVELDDGWTIATRDGSLAAHVEHTVLVGDHGPEILTKL
ncbi:MAG: type I methionyl aminopeptidase [Actinomycetota bacterium]